MRRYGKSIVALLAAVAVSLYQALGGDGNVDPVEAVSIVIAFVSAFAVYLVPLLPQAKWTKTAVGVTLAVLQVLVTVILGGLGADEVLLLFITAAGAAGIFVAPATTAVGGAGAVEGRLVVPVGVGPDR